MDIEVKIYSDELKSNEEASAVLKNVRSIEVVRRSDEEMYNDGFVETDPNQIYILINGDSHFRGSYTKICEVND